MRRLAFYLFTAALTAGVLTITASPAHAATDCGTVTTTLTGHEDGGNHGTWATEDITRKVTICPTTAGFSATVADEGRFTTVAGSSPQAGTPLRAGVQGSVKGGFTASFTATDLDLSKLIGPAAGTGTSVWVRGIVEASGGTWSGGNSINDDWSWTYTSCSERWVDSTFNQDGELPADGDITGKPCLPPAAGGGATPTHPAPTPTHGRATPTGHPVQAAPAPTGRGGVTPSATAVSVSPAPSDSYDPLAAAPTTTDPGFSVAPVVPEQVTPMVKASGSSDAGYFIGGGLALVAVVIGGVLLLRRRRNVQRHDADVTAIMPRHGSGE